MNILTEYQNNYTIIIITMIQIKFNVHVYCLHVHAPWTLRIKDKIEIISLTVF